MSTSQTNTIGLRLLNSMWAFWLMLLTGSLGLAAVIYLTWLRGNL